MDTASTYIKKKQKNKTNTPYTSKQPLMMAYEGSESARDNFEKFIYQFQLESKTLIRKLEMILNYTDKICLYYLMKHVFIYYIFVTFEMVSKEIFNFWQLI